MDFDSVKTGLASNSFTLIDVRNAGELQTDGKIPGSHNIPLSEIEEAFKMDEAAFKSRYRLEKPAQDASLVTSCKIGGRAAKAGQALSALGYSSVQVYSGSFTDWQNKGGPVEKKSE